MLEALVQPLGLALILPWIAALAIAGSGRWPNRRESLSVLLSLATFATVLRLLPGVSSPEPHRLSLGEIMPGLGLVFEVEPLGLIYAMVASGLWGLTALYAAGYLRNTGASNQTRFFACFALAIGAALAIAFAGNLLTLFLAYEVLTLSTYPLVTHAGNEEARKAGRVYLGVLMSTSIGLLLVAVIWTWQLTGTVDFQPGGILAGKAEGPVVWALLALYAFGTGKAALMPFHRWLPAAMVAPTPVSALLHAVAVVKAGVFTILKVMVYVFGADLLQSSGAGLALAYAAAFTLMASSVVALYKDNLKARLAYSTISQLAYISLGAALAAPAAWVGAALHIATHALAKITLFFCAGAIYVATHRKQISQLNGLGRRMPLTFAAFFLASLSIIGVPPGGGTWSKWLLATGAGNSGPHGPVFVAVLMLSSLLSIAYLMPVVVRAFFYPAQDDQEAGTGVRFREGQPAYSFAEMAEAPKACLIPLLITALLSALLFLGAGPVIALLQPLAESP